MTLTGDQRAALLAMSDEAAFLVAAFELETGDRSELIEQARDVLARVTDVMLPALVPGDPGSLTENDITDGAEIASPGPAESE